MTQRGAIFGLDVRLAIVLGGLMATALSAEMLTDFEGDRRVKTERKLEALRDALLLRYANTASTTFDSTLNSGTASLDLYKSGYMNSQDAHYAMEATDQTGVDGWGTTVVAATTSATKTILGASVTTHFGVLISAGPDKTVQSTTTLASEGAWQGWVVAPGSDDVAIKFNTVLIEKDKVLTMQSQLKRIMEALETYAQRNETTHVTACTASTCNCNTASTTCSGATPNVSYCDRTSDNYYCPGEEKMYNFYPTNTTEAVANPTLAYTVVRSWTTYTSGNSASMQALMTLIGLPTALATDPWGRTLRYSSNEYATTAAPYTASVWYQ